MVLIVAIYVVGKLCVTLVCLFAFPKGGKAA